MDRFRTSSKRAHSPDTPPPENASSVSQMDGSCFGKPDQPEESSGAAAAVPQATPAGPEVPQIPEFLQLTDTETREKYAELVRLENERLARGPDDEKWGRLDPNPVLDRYNNIHPWANNRIKLHVPEGVNDYINASPVTLVSTASKQSNLKKSIQDKYICMQGPKKQTVDHVWHMVWHELATPYNSSPAIVIMLSPTHGPSPDDPTKVMEKCFPYFPSEDTPEIVINETDELGDDFKGTVKFVSREPGIPGTKIEVRQFAMTVEGEDDEKPIWHYLYPNWPDFGALEEENVASILALMEISRKANGRGENPRLVHCSAGVGRTGTFVALEFLIGELLGGSWEGWDVDHAHQDPVFETVNQLREQRKTMVQAYEQYGFLYEVLRKLWEEKYGTECFGGEHRHVEKPKEKKNVCDAE
ncbi:hypothetical protein G7Y89_g2024 [Cudoniella acicularis]|uniref:Uncharacterized protein n=1 Tax=Cudoniella acicularis TaxID=354080 RepID=A0A8H4RVU6_9HELO|nr:hypothetical protein G7Y89_g2024 [Cudoniella acicularis]